MTVAGTETTLAGTFRVHGSEVRARLDARGLVDLDGEALSYGVRSQSLPENSNIRCQAPVDIAGQHHVQIFSAAPNQSTSFTWDGMDGYGRAVQGPQPARITIDYVYDAVYVNPAEGDAVFGLSGADSFANRPTREEVKLAQTSTEYLGVWDALGQGLGGWSVDAHHSYDPLSRTLYRGDGGQRTTTGFGQVATTLREPTLVDSLGFGMTVGPDGEIYYIAADGSLSNPAGWVIERLDTDGVVTRIASGTSAFPDELSGLALGPDGSLYFPVRCRLERVSPDGIVTSLTEV